MHLQVSDIFLNTKKQKRGIFRTLPISIKERFCEVSQQLKLITTLANKLHHRCLGRFLICLCKELQKVFAKAPDQFLWDPYESQY